jgi:hypothetical protein
MPRPVRTTRRISIQRSSTVLPRLSAKTSLSQTPCRAHLTCSINSTELLRTITPGLPSTRLDQAARACHRVYSAGVCNNTSSRPSRSNPHLNLDSAFNPVTRLPVAAQCQPRRLTICSTMCLGWVSSRRLLKATDRRSSPKVRISRRPLGRCRIERWHTTRHL